MRNSKKKIEWLMAESSTMAKRRVELESLNLQLQLLPRGPQETTKLQKKVVVTRR